MLLGKNAIAQGESNVAIVLVAKGGSVESPAGDALPLPDCCVVLADVPQAATTRHRL
jgi:hypothetical protein